MTRDSVSSASHWLPELEDHVERTATRSCSLITSSFAFYTAFSRPTHVVALCSMMQSLKLGPRCIGASMPLLPPPPPCTARLPQAPRKPGVLATARHSFAASCSHRNESACSSSSSAVHQAAPLVAGATRGAMLLVAFYPLALLLQLRSRLYIEIL